MRNITPAPPRSDGDRRTFGHMTDIEVGPEPETRRRHPWRRAAVVGALVAVALAAFVLVWFQPQKLFIDDEVDQAVPTATTEAPARTPRR